MNLQNNKIYKYFIKLIQISKNLESLILRIQSDKYKENINLILSLIGGLKKLRIVNIDDISLNFKFEISLETLIEEFPNLKKRIHNFEEFKINNIGFKKTLNDNIKINNNYINRIICIHKINENNKPVQIINKGDDDKYNYNKYCQLYLNKKKD